MFERIDIIEQIHKEGTPYKTITWVDANRASHGRKRKGEENALPTNPDKGRTGRCKKNFSCHLSNRTTSNKTFLVNSPGHSMEECKVIKEYSKKYAAQRTDKEARSDGKKKCCESVSFWEKIQKVNTMLSLDSPTPRKIRGK